MALSVAEGGEIIMAGGGCRCMGVVWRAADVYWHFEILMDVRPSLLSKRR
jgi:hypothetical protein